MRVTVAVLFTALVSMSAPVIADTTDREHRAQDVRRDNKHMAAWKRLIDSQESQAPAPDYGFFRPPDCRIGDSGGTACDGSRGDNESDGGHSD